jgi:hypothetical protein
LRVCRASGPAVLITPSSATLRASATARRLRRCPQRAPRPARQPAPKAPAPRMRPNPVRPLRLRDPPPPVHQRRRSNPASSSASPRATFHRTSNFTASAASRPEKFKQRLQCHHRGHPGSRNRRPAEPRRANRPAYRHRGTSRPGARPGTRRGTHGCRRPSPPGSAPGGSAAGSWARASLVTSTWSAAVFDPAFPRTELDAADPPLRLPSGSSRDVTPAT